MSPPDASQSIQDWLDYLMALHPSEIEMGLTRIKSVASAMKLDQLAPAKVITVAGTNGKGSTCAILESILLQAGFKVGVFSSPHFSHYRERVRINGKELDDSAHTQAFADIETARGDTSLTFFEFSALGALHCFANASLDWVLLEVGLGGRLDATNIIDADATIITSIDLDHQEYLGNTRDSVGREKAGVMRKGRPAIIGESDVPVGLAEQAALIGASCQWVGKDFDYQAASEHWHFSGVNEHWSELPLPGLPLANAASALACLQSLKVEVTLEEVRKGLATVALPGRMETLSEQPLVIADVAHNPHAAAYLATQLSKQPCKGKRYALVGMLHDKDIQTTLAQLDKSFDAWYCCSLNVPRGAKAETLVSASPSHCEAHEFDSIADGWRVLESRLNKQDVVIVFGSFYTVADFKKHKH
ncbi:bifunctional tetrahydrofolate synthase/dihydrofolate synthase [Paraferrimonas sedimenticola]|uniref:Dihydrofolate synthase/folylpolyglutamate synthase n=1 Tax=Paraferrimonas sedimenticola TaxID=375674 RepID=A0AA37RWH4_9GAMM|nr:bifunctional tetrahydrofolate synthase/dihydrofolate synthase [Paraferrimonas sedimenticola]GLP96574.1 bifunctional folylpolyglutamate synthase/dihydrofolate synthase [Paraferrimonas sedimenticola]